MFKSENKSESGIVLIVDVVERATSSGSPYMQVTMRDNEKVEVSAKRWNESNDTFKFQKGDFAHVTVEIGTYNGQPNYTIQSIYALEEGESVDLNQYVESAPHDAGMMYQFLTEKAKKMQEPYKSLVLNIYEDNKDKLIMWSAAKKVHHNVKAGLLWHTMYVTQIASEIMKFYPFINKDLLLTGAMLHDIGKIKELQTDASGESDYTTEGSLLGHIFIGCSMVEEYGKKLNIPDETMQLITHMIASHHGEKEWGSFVTPKIPEAYILNHADMIDAKMNQCQKALNQTEAGEWSEKVFSLGTKLFKPAVNVEENPVASEPVTAEEPVMEEPVQEESTQETEPAEDIEEEIPLDNVVDFVDEMLNSDEESAAEGDANTTSPAENEVDETEEPVEDVSQIAFDFGMDDIPSEVPDVPTEPVPDPVGEVPKEDEKTDELSDFELPDFGEIDFDKF